MSDEQHAAEPIEQQKPFGVIAQDGGDEFEVFEFLTLQAAEAKFDELTNPATKPTWVYRCWLRSYFPETAFQRPTTLKDWKAA